MQTLLHTVLRTSAGLVLSRYLKFNFVRGKTYPLTPDSFIFHAPPADPGNWFICWDDETWEIFLIDF